MAMTTAESLSLDDLAGQRVVAGFDGTVFDDDLAFLIEDLRVGGLILFSRNIETPAQVAALCRDAQACAAACGLPPLLMAVDQEGGVVARLKAPHFTEFPGNPHLKDRTDAKRFAETTARELRSVGFNMDMAPVMDVAPSGQPSVMVDRVFGTDPGRVAEMGTTVIRTFQEAGVMAVAKHFPGIGRTVLDSHIDRPLFEASAASMDAFDLPPFAAAIEANVAGIMLSHIVYNGLDPHWPASLSPVIAHDLLRRKMGYGGVVMTDDLDMGAIIKHYGIRGVARQILAADIDIALICHKGPNIEILREEMLKGIQTDSGLRERAVTAARRILDLKTRFLA